MTLSHRTALIVFAIGLISIASSQLIVKWRFGVIGPQLPTGAGATDIARAVLTDPWMWVAALLIGTGVITWYTAMTRLPLTFMLPVGGIISPIVAIGAYQFLGEPLSGGPMAAILVIAVGVAVLGYLQ